MVTKITVFKSSLGKGKRFLHICDKSWGLGGGSDGEGCLVFNGFLELHSWI